MKICTYHCQDWDRWSTHHPILDPYSCHSSNLFYSIASQADSYTVRYDSPPCNTIPVCHLKTKLATIYEELEEIYEESKVKKLIKRRARKLKARHSVKKKGIKLLKNNIRDNVKLWRAFFYHGTTVYLMATFHSCDNDIITDAEFAILTLYKSWITVTVITAIRIYTSAVGADAFLLTLVPVFALVGFGISRLSRGTLTNKRAGGVETLSALAKSGNRFALVDIWRHCKIFFYFDEIEKCYVYLLFNANIHDSDNESKFLVFKSFPWF